MNKTAGHSKRKERFTKKNRVVEHFNNKKNIKNVNKYISQVGFINKKIIEYH